jgi:hypothetical protein
MTLLPALLRAQRIWLARAHDAIRHGQAEHEFVSTTTARHQYTACRAYRPAIPI